MKATSNCSACWPAKRRVAIENARLFAEEQKKSRQLTLINNVSSHAITTLNPDEMLAKIAAEIENALTYDHIGIAILDYSSKELDDPGRSRRPPRRTRPTHCVGRRSGRPGCSHRTDRRRHCEVGPTRPRPVLPRHPCRRIALPVTYADQSARRSVRRILKALRIRRRRNPPAAHPRRFIRGRAAQCASLSRRLRSRPSPTASPASRRTAS